MTDDIMSRYKAISSGEVTISDSGICKRHNVLDKFKEYYEENKMTDKLGSVVKRYGIYSSQALLERNRIDKKRAEEQLEDYMTDLIDKMTENKLGEAIAEYESMREDLGNPIESYVELYKAAKQYHKIKPFLDEMIKARNNAAKGEWKLVWEAGRGGIIAIEAGGHLFARDRNCSSSAENKKRVANVQSIRALANNVKKIQEIMKGGE